jgi:hypothetical protein
MIAIILSSYRYGVFLDTLYWPRRCIVQALEV